MLKKIAVFVFALTSAGSLAFAGGAQETGAGQADKKFDIDLATSYAAEGPAGKALVKFVADVKEKSGGSVNINLFTDGTLGNPKDNYTSVASGDLDMAVTGLEGLDLYAPEYTFLDCPFLIKDWNHSMALLNSGIGDKLKARYEENGITTLAWHKRDIRVLASNRQVKTPSDVTGMKLRLPGMKVYVDAWGNLKVTTTTVAMSELYTALQTNVAEACEGGYEQMKTLKLYEVQKYIADTDHVFEFVGLFINRDLFKSMSDAQKKVLKDCAAESMKYADSLAEKNRENYKNECIKGGMKSVQVDKDAFRNAMTAYYKDKFAKVWTVTTYDEVMSYAK
ncbi:TRAP transporter substrate-binding protein [Treponema parvum]|uniref:TRAP transporter substrate-binding protein n=1 Tax=Treponema parvum TaxID=138851 RepID=A0A975IE27_9SPIR|nr:TRAP transporter substrate-binding protein [Treponema parvum]QTQ13605.1 TRAP transporter substrate-binding protein [Treponema parvum]